MSDDRAILQADSLQFAYRDGPAVLTGVDLTVRPGRLTCVLGPNGSGKTTLLRLLMGRLRPTGGQVLLGGRPLRRQTLRQVARQLAYVPQTPESAFAFTAREVVLLGRLPHAGAMGLAGSNDLEVARLAMEMTDTHRFADRALSELSGGEAQRVMIARALAQQPALLLLDEPTSHLDLRSQQTVYRMLRRLADEWEMAILCVSHDVNLSARYADELVLLAEGAVLAAGPVADVLREDILQAVYGLDVQLLDAGADRPPVVVAR